MKKIDSRKRVIELLQSYFTTPFEIRDNNNLYYELFFSPDLDVYKYLKISKKAKVEDEIFYNLKRGYSAFQTDIIRCEVNKEIKLPRVVFECKNDLSSHDIIPYNAKAELHKRVYPWLRYGIIDIGIEKIPLKFFTHN